jgi:hypothetical protein
LEVHQEIICSRGVHVILSRASIPLLFTAIIFCVALFNYFQLWLLTYKKTEQENLAIYIYTHTHTHTFQCIYFSNSKGFRKWTKFFFYQFLGDSRQVMKLCVKCPCFATYNDGHYHSKFTFTSISLFRVYFICQDSLEN